MSRPFFREWFAAWTLSSLWHRRLVRVPAAILLAAGVVLHIGVGMCNPVVRSTHGGDYAFLFVEDPLSQPRTHVFSLKDLRERSPHWNLTPIPDPGPVGAKLQYAYTQVGIRRRVEESEYFGMRWYSGTQETTLVLFTDDSPHSDLLLFGDDSQWSAAYQSAPPGQPLPMPRERVPNVGAADVPVVRRALNEYLESAAPWLGPDERAALLSQCNWMPSYASTVEQGNPFGWVLNCFSIAALIMLIAGVTAAAAPTKAELTAAREQLYPGYCPTCAYDLAGLRRRAGTPAGSIKCPECGAVDEMRMDAPA